MRFAVALILLALLCVGAPAAAQTLTDGSSFPGDPVEALLDLRRQLDLTRSQVAGLKEIQAELREANRPLIEQVFAVQRRVRAEFVDTGRGDQGRSGRPSRSELYAVRVPIESILRNNLAAMERVNAMLTDEQKRRAAVFLRVRDGRSDRRPARISFPG
jgi:hypothetical protein